MQFLIFTKWIIYLYVVFLHNMGINVGGNERGNERRRQRSGTRILRV